MTQTRYGVGLSEITERPYRMLQNHIGGYKTTIARLLGIILPSSEPWSGDAWSAHLLHQVKVSVE